MPPRYAPGSGHLPWQRDSQKSAVLWMPNLGEAESRVGLTPNPAGPERPPSLGLAVTGQCPDSGPPGPEGWCPHCPPPGPGPGPPQAGHSLGPGPALWPLLGPHPRFTLPGGPLRGLPWPPLSRPGGRNHLTRSRATRGQHQDLSCARPWISQSLGLLDGEAWGRAPQSGSSTTSVTRPLKVKEPSLGGTGAEEPAYPKGPGTDRGLGVGSAPLQELLGAPTPAADTASETRQGALGGSGWCWWVGSCSAPSMDERRDTEEALEGTPTEQEARPAACECLRLACGSRGHPGPVLGAS